MSEVTASIPALLSTSRPAPRRTNAATQWLPPVGLIALSLIPIIAGAVRLTELTGGAEITANNARFFASPIPVTVHIVSVSVYSLLGALQFVPSLRRGRPGSTAENLRREEVSAAALPGQSVTELRPTASRAKNRLVGRTSHWHRIGGRILVPAGLLVALSGLWMTVFYGRPPGDGESLVVVRLIVGSAMLVSIVLAVVAIRRRDFPAHGAWMTRGYAIALGAGTQVFTTLPWVVAFGPIGAGDELPRTVLMTAGWVINLVVAEYVIRRRPARRSNRTSMGLGRPRTADALAT